MSAQENDKLDRLIDQVEKMNRGLYGDAENKVPGLMQSHYEVKADVLAMKENQKKRVWMIAGFSSAASLTLPALLEWIKKTFGL
jgi:hypothetical protein